MRSAKRSHPGCSEPLGAVVTTGACLCGAVAWRTDAALRPVLECHCERCRRLTGNHLAATAVASSELTVTGDPLTWFSPLDDHNVAYGFCATCGATLFYRSGIADGTNEITSIAVGSFDGPSGLHTAAVWFAAEAGDHVRFSDSVTRYDTHPPADTDH
ncbi:MAG: GFA family protein [Ilumatobacter sp.]